MYFDSLKSCPVPLERSPLGDCEIPCEAPFISKRDSNRMLVLETTVGTIICLLLGLHILAYLIDPKLRKLRSPIVTLIVSFFLVFSITLRDITGGEHGSFCFDNVSHVQMKRHGFNSKTAPCIIQATSIAFFTLVMCCLWFRTVLQFFVKLKSEVRLDPFRSLVFCFLFPLIIVSILLTYKAFGHTEPNSFCLFFRGTGPVRWVLFFGPITFIWFVGNVLLCICFIELRKIQKLRGVKTCCLGLTGFLTFMLSFSSMVVPIMLLNLLKVFHVKRKASVSWRSCLLANYLNGNMKPASGLVNKSSLWQDCIIQSFRDHSNINDLNASLKSCSKMSGLIDGNVDSLSSSGCGLIINSFPALSLAYNFIFFLQGFLMLYMYGYKNDVLFSCWRSMQPTQQKISSTNCSSNLNAEVCRSINLSKLPIKNTRS